ncbi:Hypothetical protein HVR_LOCUS632 [uncultured virus]|nr:Hypothetical protein HVR_LOCUS632 [uncultured virus]
MATNPQTETTQQPFKPFDPLDTPAKQLIRERIDTLLTPELRRECSGLAILVLSVDEFHIVQNALKEVADRKRKEMRERRKKPLMLNVIRDPQ